MSQRDQLTPNAQSHVDRTTDFIAEDSVDAALRVHDALEEAFRHLAEMPAMGHTREDLAERHVANTGVIFERHSTSCSIHVVKT